MSFEDHELMVSVPTRNCTISVSGVPENLKLARLKLFFANRSRGGPVQDIKPSAESGQYFITFENYEGIFTLPLLRVDSQCKLFFLLFK